ncbi:MAG: hypothetical protein ACXACC_07935 [Promethearchaeota archaeon]|jgi:hypothetical protein
MDNNVEYYEFLKYVHEISKKLKSIQNDSTIIIFRNFDLCLVKKELDTKIEQLDQLLLK